MRSQKEISEREAKNRILELAFSRKQHLRKSHAEEHYWTHLQKRTVEKVGLGREKLNYDVTSHSYLTYHSLNIGASQNSFVEP